MFEFITRWFKKPAKTTAERTRSKSDAIRKHVKGKFIIPARMKKAVKVSFTAQEVAKGLGLDSHYPMVCTAIDSRKFLEFARVELLRREGPVHGAMAKWTFKIKP